MKNSERYYARLCALVNEESRTGIPADTGGSRQLLRSRGVKVKLSSDWMEAAEEALPHLRRAISQNRQELRDETEEKRIELVKKTSSDSVRDLARHSERLTDSEKGFMPRTLRVRENDSDYRTYENRFLWTALCTLRDFTDNVLRSASEAAGTSHSLTLDMRKEHDSESFALKADFTAAEKGLEAALTPADLLRSDSIKSEIQDLMTLPLLQNFTDNDLLDLPLTPTNVILMNPDFAAVNGLLDCLVSYKGEGFTTEEYELDSRPLSAEGEEELSSLLPLFCAIADAETGLLDRKKAPVPTSSRKKDSIQPGADAEKLRNEYEMRLERAGVEAEARLERELEKRDEEWAEKLKKAEAELTALRIACGQTGDPAYMTEEGFLELERQKECFDRFYEERLVLMKKAARKEYLWGQLNPLKQGKNKTPQRVTGESSPVTKYSTDISETSSVSSDPQKPGGKK